MKREYWNVPEVKKKNWINTIAFCSVFAAYTLIIYVVLLKRCTSRISDAD